MTFQISDQLISHSEIWDSHVLLERKQTSGGLVSGVLQALNIKFYLFQKALATWYSKFDKCHTPNLRVTRTAKQPVLVGEVTGTGRRNWEH